MSCNEEIAFGFSTQDSGDPVSLQDLRDRRGLFPISEDLTFQESVFLSDRLLSDGYLN
jgi:hypothetical protein